MTLNSDDEIEKIVATTDDDDDDDDDDIIKGIMEDIDDDDREIEVEPFDSSRTKTYDLARSSKLKIKIEGKSKDLDDLVDYYEDKSRVYIAITLDDDEVVKIVASTDKSDVTDDDDESLDVTILEIDKSEVRVERSDESKKWYDLYSKVKITLDGSSSSVSKIDDALDDGETVAATIKVEDGEVTKITAETKESTVKGDLEQIYNGKIRINSSSTGRSVVYDTKDEDTLTVTLNGTSSSVSKLNEAFFVNSSISVTLTRDANGIVTKVEARVN